MKQKQRNISAAGFFTGNARGFGFVKTEGTDDIFIPPRFTGGALHGDWVAFKIDKEEMNYEENKTRKIGRVIEIIKRRPMVGTFFLVGKNGFVRPLENRINRIFSVPLKSINRFALLEGQRVIFSLDKRFSDNQELPCFITEVLGYAGEPGVDILSLIHQYHIPYDFPEDALEEAAGMPAGIKAADLEGRLDLRNEIIFTIDGDDARDIDDALSLEMTENGLYKLGVHIADVAHYVREGTALDREALRRGTSIYPPGTVIPMLPAALSNGICSLDPHADRLSLSCFMTIADDGQVLEYFIKPSVINSKKRWTYDRVQELLENAGPPEDLHWLALFRQLDRLREILYDKRRNRGALDFDFPESKITLDGEGKPVSIEPYRMNNATGIVEECMIVCNETIASHYYAKKTPFIYRSHEAPEAEKIGQLRLLARGFGLSLGKNAGKPAAMQYLLEKAREKPGAYAISKAVLHSLPRARYTHDHPSHYGLASSCYTHFTSPIRRYPDLQLHRIIKNEASSNTARLKSILPEICAQCSRTEQEAEQFEREAEQLKKIQYMKDKRGQTFEGIISGITRAGAYVMLPSTIEGMIPLGILKKHDFSYDREGMVYIHKKRRIYLRVGDAVTIILLSVNEDERRILFGLQ